MKFETSLEFAKKLDKADPLKSYRKLFHIPKIKSKSAIYLVGNSLGLQPKSVTKFVNEELEDWAKLGVEGHLHSRRPWLYYHQLSKQALADIVGAKPSEVIAMNQLTVNLHLLMVSFYNPSAKRYKIITEAGAFSSDQYVLESQVRYHDFDPEYAIIELKPRLTEYSLRTDDIVATIDHHSDDLAMVLLGGVQYYTGQFFNVKKITEKAHKAGAIVGFDLAHAAGNVPLSLHEHKVDFAAWCSYKYLNAGPGGVAGAFIHEKHHKNSDLPRFSGWWGHNEKERFQMKKGFKAMPGVDGWQLSNFSVLSGAALMASLEIFEKAGMKALREKSELLTGYLEFLLTQVDPGEKNFIIITPTSAEDRGCQLSIFMKKNGKKVFEYLTKKGVLADWREPGVIRVAPVPLYNTYEEVYSFAQIFKAAIL